MTYICTVISPSEMWGSQFETDEKNALSCAEVYGRREKGENVRVIDAWTGKTLSECAYNGEKYVIPAKTEKPKKRAPRRKSPIRYEQTSLF